MLQACFQCKKNLKYGSNYKLECFLSVLCNLWGASYIHRVDLHLHGTCKNELLNIKTKISFDVSNFET